MTRRGALARALLVSGLAASLAPSGAAQVGDSASLLTVGRYLDYETVADPRVSPDGSQVVYTRRSVDRLRDRWRSTLWIVERDGRRHRFLADGWSPAWSPDGTRLAYVADAGQAGPQVFVRWIDGDGAPTQITRVGRPPWGPRWSPDGHVVGFTMWIPAKPAWEVPEPEAPRGAHWSRPPQIVDRLHHRADRVGPVAPGFTHVFAVAATGGHARDLTPGEWSVGQSATGWSPAAGWDWLGDGRSIVVEGNDAPDADLSFRVSNLYVVDAETGARRRLTATPGFWVGPRVSPDGKLVAYTGFADTRQSYRVHDLYTSTLDGGEVRRLTAELDRTPAGVEWAADGDGLYFVAEDRGTSNLHYVPKRGEPRQLTTGTHVLASPTVSRRNEAFVVRSHAHRPPDVVRVNLRRGSQLAQITEVNRDLLTGVTLGEVEEIWLTSSGGARVQGWIVKPPAFDPSQRYPLVLEVHGGPHAMYDVGFDFLWQTFAANGFVVVGMNPRGSSGYGTAFGNAIDRAYPSVDYEDLMAAVDTALGRGYVDSTRLFIGGCSGGGILTAWAIGHTDRFRAATVRCPITNWISAIGTSDVPLFGANLFERPFWEDASAWLRQSPLMYVGKVTTPTLLMTGLGDLRTPMGQTEEYYTALTLRGVPTSMVRFEDEWHGTGSRPANWMRTANYVMAWYRRWADAPR